MANVDERDEAPARFADLLRVRAFRILFLAETQSLIGDQLGRVALSVLVFDRTGNAAATAVTYAVTFLPAIAGGFLLGSLGDRFSRRGLMIAVDLARAAIFAVMAVLHLSLIVLFVLLIVAVFIGPVFSSSYASLLAAVLDGERFRTAMGIRMMAVQVSQVVGFAIAGVVIAAIHPHWTLGVDATTFLVSGLAVAVGVRLPTGRAAAAAAPPDSRSRRPLPVPRPAAVPANPRLRARLILLSLAGLYVVPEGLVLPLSRDLDAPPGVQGLLFAALPFGAVVGVLLVRRVPRRRQTWASGWMAVGCGLPLVATAAPVGWPGVLVLWTLSGAFSAYQVETIAGLTRSFPDAVRSRSMGMVGALLLGCQGVGLAGFGLVARETSAMSAIAVAGGLGSVVALALIASDRTMFRAPTRFGAHRLVSHD